MTSDHQRTVGCVPVAIYLCAGDAPAADLLAAHVRDFAEARQWTVALLAVDVDATEPLIARPGWQTVTDALSEHIVAGVVTWTRGMVHDDPMATPHQQTAVFDRLATVLRERGAFLAVATRPAAPADAIPPRRSPGDHWRRRELTSSAVGLFTPRRAAGLGSDPRATGC
ncbi:hypothetical protein ACIRS1_29205 [Kitasatospora sp. NPDC101176]|uniref:hypothetical protein n=1 Tax=Kitasatospora sp. NPDC101176 TaxID=3364099 RepID=UPI0037FB70F2